MFTFKQLEALYWVGTMGGFAHAADRLNTTQSAISKRIQDLEHLFDTPLFDRSGRTAKLTEKGERDADDREGTARSSRHDGRAIPAGQRLLSAPFGSASPN